MLSCLHGHFLARYSFKWRFYFQEYNPTVHVSAFGWNTGIGGKTAEYDVPRCPAGTPVEKCTHTISGVVTPPAGDMHFVGAHYHCHAVSDPDAVLCPALLSVACFQLCPSLAPSRLTVCLSRSASSHVTLVCRSRPAYGWRYTTTSRASSSAARSPTTARARTSPVSIAS